MKTPQPNDVVAYCPHEDSKLLELRWVGHENMRVAEGDGAGALNSFSWFCACTQCLENFDELGRIKLVNFRLWGKK